MVQADALALSESIPSTGRPGAGPVNEEITEAAVETGSDVVLAEGYYVDNFATVLDHVCRYQRNLLTTIEQDYASDFLDLSIDAQRLYVRLIMRKGPLFRLDRLHYPEIVSIVDAAAELHDGKFIDDAPDATAADLLALLVKPELTALAELPASTRRSEALEYLNENITAGEVREALGTIVLQPLGQECLEVFRLLFFGNLDQDLTEFILDELGITPYENYPVEQSRCLFESRLVLDQARVLYALRAFAREFLPELDGQALIALAQAVPRIDEPVTQQRAGRLLVRIGRQLERLGELDAALDVYVKTATAPSRERQVRIHASRDDDNEVLLLCARMLEDPVEESEVEFAIRFAHARSRKMRFSLPGWPERHTVNAYRKTVSLPATDCRVEEAARQYLESEGDEAWYVENALIPGLFGLAFWDVIFQPVPGAFLHPFQRGPIDLFTPGFRYRRQALIDERLQEIEDPDELARRVRSTFADRFPRANHFVHWGALDETLIQRALDRIPTMHLVSVFRRIIEDPRSNRAGFPDLIVFPKNGGYRLVEVKGPGDTLQANQKRWLAHFERFEMPAEVLGVEWQ